MQTKQTDKQTGQTDVFQRPEITQHRLDFATMLRKFIPTRKGVVLAVMPFGVTAFFILFLIRRSLRRLR
jgi:hypothetical protein